MRSIDLATPGSQEEFERELAGLDRLEQPGRAPIRAGWRIWSALWPKLAAIGIALVIWQLVVWSGWKDEWILPGPGPVFRSLGEKLGDGSVLEAMGLTMRRAAIGYGVALILGLAGGLVVARWRLARRAFGAFITGLQTMPSIAWFPMAIVLFKISETAITFVVVLGAAPSIANGVISGTDQVPPLFVRAGRVLGARGFGIYRTVILPASLPAIFGGLKQGWAFAWRSLMAGELLVIVAGVDSIGAQLQHARDLADYPGMYASMIVILVVGLVVDALFSAADTRMRRNRGLIDAAAARA